VFLPASLEETITDYGYYRVESSVVRIEPKMGNDRPNVSWVEWDGMLRVCFNRRNKTLRSSWLGPKEVLSMVERNYRVWCSMNDIPLEEGITEDDDDAEGDEMEVDENVEPSAGDEADDEWGGFMDVEGTATAASGDDGTTLSFLQALKQASIDMPKTKSKKKKTKVATMVREKIRKVLEDDTDLADKRAGKLDENDYLRLLAAFNAEGLHFA
jgi:18S rRNA (adenine1779-N6/adenine1780-N6)-dimethyltransferase